MDKFLATTPSNSFIKEEVIGENQVTVPILEELVEALKKGRIQIDTLFEDFHHSLIMLALLYFLHLIF